MTDESATLEPFVFEKEQLDQLEVKLGPVLKLSQKALRAEVLGYLANRDYKIWQSISTNKGELRNPRFDRSGRASAQSEHSETEVLQAIVYIERWKAARRSAGSRKAAVTRKQNAIKMKQMSALLKQTRQPTQEQLLRALTIERL